MSNISEIGAWIDTVPENPWVFGGQLKPISAFFKDPIKKDDMDTAIREYLNSTWLESLKIRIEKEKDDFVNKNPVAGLLISRFNM